MKRHTPSPLITLPTTRIPKEPIVARHLIMFKNKSEEEAFIKLAQRVYTLRHQTKEQMIYTYDRVFKYLIEMLPR